MLISHYCKFILLSFIFFIHLSNYTIPPFIFSILFFVFFCDGIDWAKSCVNFNARLMAIVQSFQKAEGAMHFFVGQLHLICNSFVDVMACVKLTKMPETPAEHKCRDVGMDPSAVQVRREVKDVLGLLDHQERNDFLYGFDHPQSSSMNLIFSMCVFGGAKILNAFKLKSRLLGSMTSSVANSPLIMHPLDRLIEWYFCQRYRRSSMLCQTVEQILDFGSVKNVHETKLAGQATPEKLSHVNKVEMVLMFEWVEQLEEFEHELENSCDKTQLLREFPMKFLLLDTLLFGLEEGFNDRILFANGAYIHSGNPYRSISPPFGSSEDERSRLRAMEMMNDERIFSMIEELIQPFVDQEITFGEFMTLRLLLFWDPENADDSPKGEIIKNASRKALNNLQSWYELHSIGGTQRLENILLFLPIIKKYAAYLSEITLQIPDFNLMPEWQFISDLVFA